MPLPGGFVDPADQALTRAFLLASREVAEVGEPLLIPLALHFEVVRYPAGVRLDDLAAGGSARLPRVVGFGRVGVTRTAQRRPWGVLPAGSLLGTGDVGALAPVIGGLVGATDPVGTGFVTVDACRIVEPRPGVDLTSVPGGPALLSVVAAHSAAERLAPLVVRTLQRSGVLADLRPDLLYRLARAGRVQTFAAGSPVNPVVPSFVHAPAQAILVTVAGELRPTVVTGPAGRPSGVLGVEELLEHKPVAPQVAVRDAVVLVLPTVTVVDLLAGSAELLASRFGSRLARVLGGP